jgi:arylsulfatase A-like enzyme
MVLGLISPSPLLGQSQKPNIVMPIRSALSVVTVLGDANFLRPETPTIAEFFKKNGYTTYFWGKWHLGGKT